LVHAIERPEPLDPIAEGSMHDRWIHSNPRKINGPAVIRTRCDAAWLMRASP
jgi:maleylacetate reductase